MGLFQSKQQPKKKSQAEEVKDEAANVFDEKFREELRQLGREQFKKLIDNDAAKFKKDLDSSVSEITTELKSHMTSQLDAAMIHINAELANQLDKRLVEHDRLTKDAQDLAVQSLNRNAHAMHEKYQQLIATLQQALASQEATMIGVFEENKARITSAQNAQSEAMKSLNVSAQAAQKQTKQLSQALEKSADEQKAMMSEVVKDNKARVNATKEAQDAALKSLNDSAQALADQHQRLSEALATTVADQKAMMVDVFQDNMARIIEHYLLGALGDQYDMKTQLPMIIKQMEDNKQAIVDDMKL